MSTTQITPKHDPELDLTQQKIPELMTQHPTFETQRDVKNTYMTLFPSNFDHVFHKIIFWLTNRL
jgi:hypothetical protein